MRSSRLAVATLAFITGGSLLAPPASANAAADTSPPALTGVTASPDAVSVAGVDLVPVTVTAHLTDDTEVAAGALGQEMIRMPYLVLSREVGGRTATEAVELELGAGTVQDGFWTATVQVPSTWNGHWEVSEVVAVDSSWNRLAIDPRDLGTTATLDVTGAHLPAVTMQFEPDPVVGDAPFTVRGRFYYTDTGEGIANQPIFIGEDSQCVEGAIFNARTAADGTFSRAFPAGDPYLRCAGIPRPSNLLFGSSYIVYTAAFPPVRPTIAAKANPTVVRLGGKLTFSGVVEPTSGYHAIEVQQIRNGMWRTVATGEAFDQGRFTVEVTPKSVGRLQYRVIVPNEDPELVGVSRTIPVLVTP